MDLSERRCWGIITSGQNRLRWWDVLNITVKDVFEKMASFSYRLNFWLLRKGQLHAAECSDRPIDQ